MIDLFSQVSGEPRAADLTPALLEDRQLGAFDAAVGVRVGGPASSDTAGTMSRENLEIVRRVLEEWEHGNFRAPAKFFDPGIAFETFMPDASENVVAQGSAEFQAFTRDWLAQWREYRIAAEELQEVGQDKVFASVRQKGEGWHSGVEVESAGFAVWTLRGGKVTKLSLHYDRDEALEAAGLKE